MLRWVFREKLCLDAVAEVSLGASRHGVSAMRQVSDWLGALGLKQYAKRFVKNDIDFAVLRDLTDQDLEKIGALSLGHRRKILRAIAELTGVLAPEPGGMKQAIFSHRSTAGSPKASTRSI